MSSVEFSKKAALVDLKVAQEIVRSVMGGKIAAKSAPRIDINKIPGFAPMQLRAQINKIVELRQEATTLRTQFESVLSKLSTLEKEEKDGISKLTDAARQIKEKERFLVTAEKGMLEFTAFIKDQVPGVEQMIGDPNFEDPGAKAGAFFIKVGEKFGEDMMKAVALIYLNTKDDLTHTADCIRGLKVVEKTASVSVGTIKKAGIGDMIVSIKEWLTGKNPDSIAAKFLGFLGNISKFVKGFVERTGIVKKGASDLDKAIADAKRAILKTVNG